MHWVDFSPDNLLGSSSIVDLEVFGVKRNAVAYLNMMLLAGRLICNSRNYTTIGIKGNLRLFIWNQYDTRSFEDEVTEISFLHFFAFDTSEMWCVLAAFESGWSKYFSFKKSTHSDFGTSSSPWDACNPGEPCNSLVVVSRCFNTRQNFPRAPLLVSINTWLKTAWWWYILHFLQGTQAGFRPRELLWCAAIPSKFYNRLVAIIW